MNLLSNMVSAIKAGSRSRQLSVITQNSKLCVGVLSVLYRLGYIRGFSIKNKRSIVVMLKYVGSKSVLRSINVVSTPGRRVYIKNKALTRVLQRKDSGFLVLSTSLGLLTDEESAMRNVGGELLVKVS
jgi:small subunit ribosomal protein S8